MVLKYSESFWFIKQLLNFQKNTKGSFKTKKELYSQVVLQKKIVGRKNAYFSSILV